MLMRHVLGSGLPFTRTSTGIGRRQAGFRARARASLTRTNGLPSRIFMLARKRTILSMARVRELTDLPQGSGRAAPERAPRVRAGYHPNAARAPAARSRA